MKITLVVFLVWSALAMARSVDHRAGKQSSLPLNASGLRPLTAPAEETDFCRNPYEAICAFPEERKKAKDAAREKAVRAKQEALKEKGLPSDSSIFDLLPEEERPGLPGPRIYTAYGPGSGEGPKGGNGRLETYIAYLTSLVDRLKGDRNPGNAALNDFVPVVNKALQVRNGSPTLQLRLLRLRVVTGGEELMKLLGKEERLRAYQKSCGRDGLHANAFYALDVNAVFLCPGLFAQPEEAFSHVLFHELGHSADSLKEEDLFRDYGKCLLENYNRPGGEPITDPFRFRLSYLREITADYWAAAAVAQRLREVNDSAERLSRLRTAVQSLCDAGEEEEHLSSHPVPRYRIGVILGRHPDIREAMQCPAPTEEAPLCGVGGRVPER